MNTDNIKSIYKAVCEAPSGSGCNIDYMPGFLYKGEIDDATPHVHTFYEILWFQEGTGRHFVDFQEYPVKPGTIFFLAPGQVHHFDGSSDYKGLAIKLCSDLLQDDSNTDAFVNYNVFNTFESAPYFIIDEKTARQLSVIVEEIEEELNLFRSFAHLDVLRSLLKLFLIKVYRYGQHEGESRLDDLKPSHKLYMQFRRLLEKQYTKMHSVQEYADALNVAVRTLNKSANECCGQSPLSIINDRIMLEAKRQVRYTNLMIKEIAFNLGYDDPSYFVKLFKRETGYLPSDFRELDEVSHCKV